MENSCLTSQFVEVSVRNELAPRESGTWQRATLNGCPTSNMSLPKNYPISSKTKKVFSMLNIRDCYIHESFMKKNYILRDRNFSKETGNE